MGCVLWGCDGACLGECCCCLRCTCTDQRVGGHWQAVFPAFFTLYVAQERRSSVQAMQFSNGLSNPAGLWLGHLMFDSIFSVVAATILVAVFSTQSTLFTGLGYLVCRLPFSAEE